MSGYVYEPASFRGERVWHTITGRQGTLACDTGRWLNGRFVVDVVWSNGRKRSCGVTHLVWQ